MTFHPPEKPNLKYRSDIDGLRAVAVLAVVGFHSFPNFFKAGFFGVDVFFVISGFLISSIIYDELEGGHFLFVNFYARRARRIFPALIVVLTASLAFGWTSLMPDEYTQLGEHVAASAGFFLNMILWHESGYFDTAAAAKPLLHIWSLGVEEQYYIVWPAILMAAWTFKKLIQPLLIIGIAVSFFFSAWASFRHPALAFYLLPSRFWELMSGALLAKTSRPGNVRDSRQGFLSNDMKSFLCIFLIVASMLVIGPARHYSALWALMPVIGTLLIVWGGPLALINRHVLSHRYFVAVGLISYPLYLWHWPLLSLARVLEAQTPSPAVRLTLVFISFVLAWLTYKYVESPMRFGSHKNAKAAALCAVLAVVGVTGYITYQQNGFPQRHVVDLNVDAISTTLGAGNELVEPGCGVPKESESLFMWCFHDKRDAPHFAVWGDSHAYALYWGLVRESSVEERWLLIGEPSCPPMVGVDISEDCTAANHVALTSLISNDDIKLVLLGGAKRDISDQQYRPTGENKPTSDSGYYGLSRSIEALQKAGKRVAIVIDNPTLPDPKECMTSRVTTIGILNKTLPHKINPNCSITYRDYLASTADYRRMISRLQERFPALLIYDPSHLLCDESADTCAISKNGMYLYSFGDHLSDYANGLIARKIIPAIDHADRQ
jgi:peptidoglycan/LPS O-acetylase OafA/YrhL